MLTHPTVDQLVKLGLAGMARAFTEMQGNHSAAALDHAEWLALLLEREATERSNRQLIARLRHAKLRQRATIEDIDWRAPRGLEIGARSYGSINSILDTGLDRQPFARPAPELPLDHPNIRGSRYYH